MNSFLIGKKLNIDLSTLSESQFSESYDLDGDYIVAGFGTLISHETNPPEIHPTSLHIVARHPGRSASELSVRLRLLLSYIEVQLRAAVSRKGDTLYFDQNPVCVSKVVSDGDSQWFYVGFFLDALPLESLKLSPRSVALSLMNQYTQEMKSISQTNLQPDL